MLTAIMLSWATLARCCTFGRPNYLLVQVRWPPRRWIVFLFPLFVVRTIVEDACWVAGGLRYFPGIRKRVKAPAWLWRLWGRLMEAVPEMLRFGFPFTLLQLRDGETRVSASVV